MTTTPAKGDQTMRVPRPAALTAALAAAISLTCCSSPAPAHVLRVPPVPAPAPAVPASAPPVRMVEIGDGTHEIGDGVDHVPAGKYRTPGPRADGIGQCFWARLSGLGGTPKEIIAIGVTAGAATVAIDPADTAFRSDGCKPWARLQR